MLGQPTSQDEKVQPVVPTPTVSDAALKAPSTQSHTPEVVSQHRAEEAQPQPSVQDQKPNAQMETKRPGRLTGSVSIREIMAQTDTIRPTIPQKSSEPLNQERLLSAWKTLMDELKGEASDVGKLLQDHEVRLVDETHFSIIVHNSAFARSFRQYQTEVLERLRSMLGQPELVCSVEVEIEQGRDVIYQPTEKYQFLLKKNPNLALLQRILPHFDY